MGIYHFSSSPPHFAGKHRFLLFLLGTVLFFSACHEDALPDFNGEGTPESLQHPPLESAQKWYDDLMGGKPVLMGGGEFRSSESSDLLFHQPPSWRFYCITETSAGFAVDVDMTDRIGLDFVMPENIAAFEETSDWQYRHSHTRLVVLTSRSNGRQTGFLMTVVPSKTYVEEHRSQIRKITYLNRAGNFDGMILFHHANGVYSNGWLYRKGEIVGTVHQQKPEGDALPLEMRILPASYTVSLNVKPSRLRSAAKEDDVAYGITLPDVIITPDNPPSPPSQPDPWWWYPSAGPGGGGYPGDGREYPSPPPVAGDGGGSDGGYSPPPPAKLNNNLAKLFKGKNSLKNDDIKKLNEAHEKMREKCIYEYIDNYLMQNNVQLNNISIDPNYGGQAGISNTGNLTFWNSNEINSHNLAHEWLHLFQKQYHSMATFGDKRGMMEFELALTQDILKFIEIGGKTETVAYTWACYTTSKFKYEIEYKDWLKEITNNGTSYPTTINEEKFQYFSRAFGEVSISYNSNRGYTYGNTAYDSSAIQALFNQAKQHCNK